jgi:filamentous hemagglutinin family protein
MRTKVFLMTPLACACVAAMAQSLPSGATITQGAGKVSVTGNAMVVDQSTQRMVADWQSFSIGAGSSVRFVQPSTSSVALNRVVGSDPSSIFGSLSANGHVYLQNPNGVLFAPGAQVDVGSLVATTLNADIGEFMAGRLRLSGTSGAAVVNDGQITTVNGGHVVLAAAQVANNGGITTPGGTTALVAAGAVDVDPTGSGLLTISVPVAAVGASLVNRGSITADGGAVQLHAAATDAARRTVMQVDGIVRARSIEERDGQIVLSAGSSGVVAVGGTLDASGGDGAKGGTVKVLGDRVAVLGSARVDASGANGGGTVLLGGNWQGHDVEPTAQATYVADGAIVDASATGAGDGGTVVVWSDGHTRFDGRIDARGGGAGGDGGRVEVSGKQLLDMNGSVDTRAPSGRAGSLLLDPANLEVGTTANVDGVAPTGDDLPGSTLLYGQFPTAPLSQITAARVASLLATGDVTLQATNSLSVIAPISGAAGGAASTLTLNSPTITLGAALTLNNAALVADTQITFSDSIRVNAPVSSLSSIALTANDIGINAALSAPTTTLTVPNSTFGTIGQTAPGAITAGTLTLARGTGADVTLNLGTAANQIDNLRVTANRGTVNVVNPAGTPLDIRGSVNGAFTLTTNTGVVQTDATATSALFVGGTFGLTTSGTDPLTGAVVLTNPNNDFVGTVTFNSASNVSITGAKDPLSAQGSAALNINLVSANGPFQLAGNIVSTSTTTPGVIDITGNGFTNGNSLLQVQTGGRFIVRSSNFAADAFGPIAFGTGAADVNNVILAGWTGATPATGNLYITNASGTIATPATDIANVSKVYDGTTGFSYTQTGTTATGTLTPGPVSLPLFGYTLTSTGTFADKNVGTDKAYTIAATNNVIGTGRGGEQYYGLAFAGLTRPGGTGAAGVSAITPRPLTSTGIGAIDRVYDATTIVALNTSAAALNNVVAGDAVALAIGGATGTMANKNAGTGKAVTVSGLGLTGADAGNYTVTDASGATVTISPRPINAIGVTAVNRVYDGTTAVALNTSAATLAGVLGGDAVTIGGGTGTMADKTVGIAKPVTISAITLGGADAGNYIAAGVGTPTVDIALRTITSTGIVGVDRDYDGTTAVALDASAVVLSNAVAGDAVAISTAAATGTMADKNVGTAKPVVIAGLSLSGADASNYALVDASGATVNIAPRALTPTGITATNRVVDGTTNVTIDTSGASVLGIVPGDVVTLNSGGATGSVETPDPGNAKPVFVSGLTLTGTDAPNYSILSTPVTPRGSGLTVRILTVQAAAFEQTRYKEYLEGISDAQEPFRRAMAEALASGFGKENIRKQLTRGLVFETGLAAPAVDRIEPAARPVSCTASAGLACGR